MGLRILTRPQPCVLQRHKGIVGLVDCQGDGYICNERHHRIFTGMAMMQGPDNQWLIESSPRWWYSPFNTDSGVFITRPGVTDADELETCAANSMSPMLPLSPEGTHKVAKELIAHYQVNNQEVRGDRFSRMEFCSMCNKLKLSQTEFISTEALRQSSGTFLLPQYGHPITWMMRSSEGLCNTQH